MTVHIDFKKVTKKYALNNSYFKNRLPNAPATPYEVADYVSKHGELPFSYHGENWLYDCFVEYQKRAGVVHDQFFTPDDTAHAMCGIAEQHFCIDDYVLDACCGFGQLSKPLVNTGRWKVHGFDFNPEFEGLYKTHTGNKASFECCDFDSFLAENASQQYKQIIANPPYAVKDLTRFFAWLDKVLTDDGVVILLLPCGFIDKERPKATATELEKWHFFQRQDMAEKFARTGVRAEIVVARKTI